MPSKDTGFLMAGTWTLHSLGKLDGAGGAWKQLWLFLGSQE
jgi:hypothetical protein